MTARNAARPDSPPGRGFLPAPLYKTIYSLVPIVCVDILIHRPGAFALGLRMEEPARGQWFPPGGRVYKGETLKQAARRKLREEIGLNAPQSQFTCLGVWETMFKTSSLGGSKHTVNVVFAFDLGKRTLPPLDRRHHAQLRWFSVPGRSWHPYVKALLATAGFGFPGLKFSLERR